MSMVQSITLMFCRSTSFLTSHSSLRSFTVLTFPHPIVSYKDITFRLHPYLSVCCLFPSVCLRLSVCFSVTKADYLPTATQYIFFLFMKVSLFSKSVKMCNLQQSLLQANLYRLVD